MSKLNNIQISFIKYYLNNNLKSVYELSEIFEMTADEIMKAYKKKVDKDEL